MSLLISQQYNDAITQNSDLLISLRRRSTSFLKLTVRISVTLGAESATTVFPNSLTTRSDLLPRVYFCFFWHNHQCDNNIPAISEINVDYNNCVLTSLWFPLFTLHGVIKHFCSGNSSVSAFIVSQLLLILSYFCTSLLKHVSVFYEQKIICCTPQVFEIEKWKWTEVFLYVKKLTLVHFLIRPLLLWAWSHQFVSS